MQTAASVKGSFLALINAPFHILTSYSAFNVL